MEEKDITLADMILASLMSESEHIMLYVIHEKATDEAQAQRVILSLCSYGAAHARRRACGTGASEKTVPSLFLPFFRVKKQTLPVQDTTKSQFLDLFNFSTAFVHWQ